MQAGTDVEITLLALQAPRRRCHAAGGCVLAQALAQPAHRQLRELSRVFVQRKGAQASGHGQHAEEGLRAR